MPTVITCPQRKGKGRGKIPYFHKWLAPFTLGVSLVIGDEEREICPICNGDGYVVVKET